MRQDINRGPKIIPIGPYTIKPPNKPRNNSSMGSFVFLPMKMGLKKLSVSPITKAPQKKRKIPAPLLAVINIIIAMGAQTSVVPPNGIRAAMDVKTPIRIGEGTLAAEYPIIAIRP